MKGSLSLLVFPLTENYLLWPLKISFIACCKRVLRGNLATKGRLKCRGAYTLSKNNNNIPKDVCRISKHKCNDYKSSKQDLHSNIINRRDVEKTCYLYWSVLPRSESEVVQLCSVWQLLVFARLVKLQFCIWIHWFTLHYLHILMEKRCWIFWVNCFLPVLFVLPTYLPSLTVECKVLRTVG